MASSFNLMLVRLLAACALVFSMSSASAEYRWEVTGNIGGTASGCAVTKTGIGARPIDALNAWFAFVRPCQPTSEYYPVYDQLQCQALIDLAPGATTANCSWRYTETFGAHTSGTSSLTAVRTGTAPTIEETFCKTMKGSASFVSQTGRLSPGQRVCMQTGCYGVMSDTLLHVTDKTTSVTSTEGRAIYDGDTCAYTPATGAQNDSCPGGTLGEVNGASYCAKYDPDLNVIESTKAGTTTVSVTPSSPDGTATTTTQSTTTSTKCEAGKCTTTTTTTTAGGPGGAGTTTEKKEEQTVEDFCKANPKDAACKEDSSFSASCDQPPVCKGDAVMCAIAKSSHEAKCLMSPSADIVARAGEITAGTWAGGGSVQTRALGNFNKDNPFTSQCPADQTVTAAGFSFSIPLSQACTALQAMGNLIVAFTIIGATVFVLKGFGV